MKVYLIFYIVFISTILFSVEEYNTCRSSFNLIKSKNFSDDVYVESFTTDRNSNIIMITSNRKKKPKTFSFKMTKLDKNLERVWEIQLNSLGFPVIYTDNSNNIIIVCHEGTPIKNISSISKFSENGKLQWTTKPKAKNDFSISDMEFDESNNIYIVGNLHGYVRVGFNIINTILPSFRDGFIAKLTPNGDWIKCKDTNIPFDDYISDIEIIDGCIYTWGGFERWSGLLRSLFRDFEANYEAKCYVSKYNTDLKKQLEFKLNIDSNAFLGENFPLSPYISTTVHNNNFVAIDTGYSFDEESNGEHQWNADIMILDSMLNILFSEYEKKLFSEKLPVSFHDCIFYIDSKFKSILYDFSDQALYLLKPEENESFEKGFIDHDMLYILSSKKDINSKNYSFILNVFKTDPFE